MRHLAHARHHLLAFVLACGLSPIIKAQDTRTQDTKPQDTRAQDTKAQGTANGFSAQERAQTQAQAQPDIERQRQDAERQAQQTLDRDAIAAIQETPSGPTHRPPSAPIGPIGPIRPISPDHKSVPLSCPTSKTH